MISIPQGLKGKGKFARGIHPAENKAFAETKQIEVLPAPAQVNIPILQHVGAPCDPIANFKDEVAVGQKIASTEAFISAPIHSSVNGVAQRPAVVTLPNGRHVKTIPIKADGEQPEGQALFDDIYGGEWPTDKITDLDPKKISDKVREAGIVGQGGAAFPTFVKLLRNEERPVKYIVVNGCECEPYLTADHRLMLEAAEAIICGVELARHAAGAQEAVIAIEGNKMDVVKVLEKAAEGTGIKIAVVKTQYPMGGEKQMVKAVTGAQIPTGGLPLDVGVVVINVGTAAAIARAVLRNKPLTHRVVTVTGAGITEPKNILAPVGVSIQELIDFCGGLTDDCARVVAGGPMMGFAIPALNIPVTKGTSGITCLTKADINKAAETNCVRCGRCVDICPVNLVPTKIALASRAESWDMAKSYHIQACIECGCCAYTCPASIPLVQLIRMGKVEIMKEARQKK
ncbi:electron transport complex subunit RsxC [Verrucomicrobiota bacterium]